MSQVYVIDAGVLFSTWTMKVADITLVTTSNIMTEVQNRPSQLRADILLLVDRMRIVNPEATQIQQTREASIRSGDHSVLSDTDIELVALALMLKDEGENVTLVSTDFAVLNIASQLDIPIIDPNQKFKQKISWGMRCPACYYKSKTSTRDTECPVCVTPMRRTPLRKHKRS